MKITAIMPVRNEDWVLGLSARAVLMWADELVILDHASTDATMDIVGDLMCEFRARLRFIVENNPVWEEMRHRQRLLDVARERGATHIAIVDADEVLTGHLIHYARQMFEQCPGGKTLQLPWLCLRNHMDRYHNAGLWGEQYASMGFKDAAALHWKARNGYDFHHRHPMGRTFEPYRPVMHRHGGLMHLQFLSMRRLHAKQALYKMTEVVRWPGRDTAQKVNQRYDYAVYGRDTNEAGPTSTMPCETPRGVVPVQWWEAYQRAGLMKYLQPDAEPWQEAECRRLWAQHGPDTFKGLNLYGVVG